MHRDLQDTKAKILWITVMVLLIVMPLGGMKANDVQKGDIRSKVEDEIDVISFKGKSCWLVDIKISDSLKVDYEDGCSQNIVFDDIYIQNALIFSSLEEGGDRFSLVSFGVDANSLKNCELVFTVLEGNVSYNVSIKFVVDNGSKVIPKYTISHVKLHVKLK